MKIERYTWSDALIDAQAAGTISNGALLLAMKLAKEINWKPTDKRPPGLYWKTQDALKKVGASRTTYFDHREDLMNAGFLIQKKGNLLPTMPQESAVRTTEQSAVRTESEPKKSVVRTKESVVRTEQSVVRNPLSVDICSEDVLSEETAAFADAQAAPVVREVRTDIDGSSDGSTPATVSDSRSGDDAESVVRTVEDLIESAWKNRKAMYHRQTDEKYWDAVLRLAQDSSHHKEGDSPMSRVIKASQLVSAGKGKEV